MSIPVAPGQPQSIPGSWPENPQSASTQSDASRPYQSDWQASGPSTQSSYLPSHPQDLTRNNQEYVLSAAPKDRQPDATNSTRIPPAQPITTGNQEVALGAPVRRPSGSRLCAKCGNSLSGQFVRALDATYHLECFTCYVSIR